MNAATATETEVLNPIVLDKHDPAIVELDGVVRETNSLAVQDGDVKALVGALVPVVTRIERYKSAAANLAIATEDDAKRADELYAEITRDMKLVEEVVEKHGHVSAIHSLHRRWTTFRGKLFVDPLEATRKQIKGIRDKWTLKKQEEAAAEQRRLQAIEEEKARKERERQEAIARAAREKEEAARRAEEEARRQAQAVENEAERKRLLAEAERKRKEAEYAAAKAQFREQNAASVVATVVTVAAPTMRKGAKLVWRVKSIDMTAMGIPVAVQGFVEVKATNLERSKAANPMFTLPGVTFHQVSI